MPQSFASLHYHIIFSTKNREPWITDDIREPLYETIGGILRAHEGALLAAGGVADHIHLLAGIGKRMAVADASRVIKSNSSSWIHDPKNGR